MKKFFFLLAFVLAFGYAGAIAHAAGAEGDDCSSIASCGPGLSCDSQFGICLSNVGTSVSNDSGESGAKPETNCPSGTVLQDGVCVSSGGAKLPGNSGAGGSSGGGLNLGVLGSGFTQPNVAGLSRLTSTIVGFINGALVPLLVAIAFLAFLWGVANAYILHPADETKRKVGHQFILWGIIGLVIIFSVWGIVNLLLGTLFFTGAETHPSYPTL